MGASSSRGKSSRKSSHYDNHRHHHDRRHHQLQQQQLQHHHHYQQPPYMLASKNPMSSEYLSAHLQDMALTSDSVGGIVESGRVKTSGVIHGRQQQLLMPSKQQQQRLRRRRHARLRNYNIGTSSIIDSAVADSNANANGNSAAAAAAPVQANDETLTGQHDQWYCCCSFCCGDAVALRAATCSQALASASVSAASTATLDSSTTSSGGGARPKRSKARNRGRVFHDESYRITNLKSQFQVSTTHLSNQTNEAPTFATTTNQDCANMAATYTNVNNNNNNIHKASNGNAPCHKQASLERGLAMSEEERKSHGLLGLLPAAVQDQELQSKAVINFIDNCKDELSKYVYLRHLKDFNEKLFYYTLTTNVEKCMPLVYTPTVGLACQKFSEIYMRPRGLFITARDAGRIKQILSNWPEKDVRVIVVTDGERILGLGDLGANGMGISIGKLSLYTALAGIPPQNVLPITIDVGTNNAENLKDPFYIGLRQQRVRGEKYDQLLEEFMQAVVDRWGRSCLIQFEDFANATAFDLLKRYRDDYCTFNDDIQGTASVCLSGLISAAKVIGKRLRDCSFLFYGAGEANLGTAHLLIMAMVEDGLGKAEAKRHIYLVDSKGLVVTSRTDLTEHKREFAQEGPHIKDLEEIIGHTKPTAIIGASAQAGAFNESICKKMAQFNEKPIIFALSNPTSKAECTASQAYEWTDGKCVFASGSPFSPVEYKGKTYITGQGNNAYIFPGVGLAAIGAHTHIIPEEAFLVAARALSDQVQASDTAVGLVYPKLSKIRDVTLRVATRVLEYLYSERLASYRPEPSDKLEFLKGIQYDTRY